MTKIRFAPNVLFTKPPSSTTTTLSQSAKAKTQHSSVFPIEVYERIIDYIAEENWDPIHPSIWGEDIFATLQACALTCRAWVPRSQRYLFRFLGASASPHDEKSIHNLYALLARYEHLHLYVRALSVRGDETQGTPALHVLPLRASQLLPRLQRLHVSSAALYLPQGARVGLRHFAALGTLHLRGVHFFCVQDLRHIVSALRALKVLSVEWPTWEAPCVAPPPHHVPRCRTRLEELLVAADAASVGTQNVAWFLEWLTLSGAVAHLEYASFHNMIILDERLLAAVAALLREAAGAVWDVGLAWGPEIDPSPLYTALTRCSQLEFLGLVLAYHTRSLAQLAALFTKLRTRCEPLNITLINHPTTCVAPAPADWAALDRVFQQRQWRYVRHIFVDRITLPVKAQSAEGSNDGRKQWEWGDPILSGTGWQHSAKDVQDWEELLRRSLPLTCKRGILKRSKLGDGYVQDHVKVL